MTDLANKRGTWINQFALPAPDLFVARGKQVDYVMIKYGHPDYEKLAFDAGIPWLAERMGESGVGSQNGPANAQQYANELADQAMQPGCVGAVINLEEGDGGWHTDDGSATRGLVETFKSRCPLLPLFASIDTRGNRPNYPYQQVLAELCDGVMPEVYPGAFGLPATASFATSLTPLMLMKWNGKDVLPTFQTYSPPDVSVLDEVSELTSLYNQHKIQGANSYTMGHATDDQWAASLGFKPALMPAPMPPPPAPVLSAEVITALVALRKAWVAQWTAIADHGTALEAAALADYWRKLVGA